MGCKKQNAWIEQQNSPEDIDKINFIICKTDEDEIEVRKNESVSPIFQKPTEIKKSSSKKFSVTK